MLAPGHGDHLGPVLPVRDHDHGVITPRQQAGVKGVQGGKLDEGGVPSAGSSVDRLHYTKLFSGYDIIVSPFPFQPTQDHDNFMIYFYIIYTLFDKKRELV